MEIRVRDLGCARGGRAVIAHLSFDLAAGEAIILRGPNGSGKTTLLRTLAGLQPPTAGDAGGMAAQAVYAGHADGVKSALSVAENLGFWAEVLGARAGAVAGAIGAFGLQGLRERPAGWLSAGQRRRLGLARLLVDPRPVWLLDEPTVSLDAAAVGTLEGVIARHLAAGGAAIIATHVAAGPAGARVIDLGAHAARPGQAPRGAFDEAVG